MENTCFKYDLFQSIHQDASKVIFLKCKVAYVPFLLKIFYYSADG